MPPSRSIASLMLALLGATACAVGHADAPPARLVAGANDTIVVNEYLATRLPVRSVDADGHDVPASGLRFQQSSGDPIALSALGIVHCDRSADAGVRATLGSLSRSFRVLCRPVIDLRTMGSADLVIGDSARELSIRAIGPDSATVAPLAGSVAIDDAKVAEVRGLRVRARAPGMTEVHVRIGNFSRGVMVTTYERLASLESVGSAHPHVLVPVRLAPGEQRRWQIPRGFYLVTMSRSPSAESSPRLAFEGVRCEKGLGPESYLCEPSGAMTVVAYQPASASGDGVGQIAMRRIGR